MAGLEIPNDVLTNNTSELQSLDETNYSINNLNQLQESDTSLNKEKYIGLRALSYTAFSVGLTGIGAQTLITGASMTGQPMLATLIPGALLFILGIAIFSAVISSFFDKDVDTHEKYNKLCYEKTLDTILKTMNGTNEDFIACVRAFTVSLLATALLGTSL